MSEPLTPTDEEISWWEEAYAEGEEAEALLEWLCEFIEDYDATLRFGRYAPGLVEKASNLTQLRDSYARAWGLLVPARSS